MRDNAEQKDRYLPPGTKVRCDGSDDGSEFGVVVHCWMSDEIHQYDCYIAFFGNELPTGTPTSLPYVLRYASTSLTVLS